MLAPRGHFSWDPAKGPCSDLLNTGPQVTCWLIAGLCLRNLEWWAKFVVRAWMKVTSSRKPDTQWSYFIYYELAGCLWLLQALQWVQGRSLLGVQGVKTPEAPAILQYTVRCTKNCPKKPLSWYILCMCCIQIERRNSFKLKKFMCKANNSTSCSVNTLKCITW